MQCSRSESAEGSSETIVIHISGSGCPETLYKLNTDKERPMQLFWSSKSSVRMSTFADGTRSSALAFYGISVLYNASPKLVRHTSFSTERYNFMRIWSYDTVIGGPFWDLLHCTICGSAFSKVAFSCRTGSFCLEVF